jgi:hypothetical protein
MLGKTFPTAWFKRNLVPRQRWQPYPRYADRTDWNSLSAATRKNILDAGRRVRQQPWPALPATLYLEFARIGNRQQFEAPWFERRQQLDRLVLAECVEGRGAFLDAIVNALWSICEESTWSLPAHIPVAGLPDPAIPHVDLFAAETGSQLAWIHYLLADALNGVAPVIGPRLDREILSRILTPCLERDDFFWMGFKQRRVNNWNPWINSNWLSCNLLIEPDPDRRVRATAKILRSLAVFADTYPDDGGCDEGPSYWTRAGASLFDSLDLIHRATRGRLDFFKHPKIREIGRFIYRAHLADRWFLNFADAPALMSAPAARTYRFGLRIGDRAMQNFARSFLTDSASAASRASAPLLHALPDLFDSPRLRRGTACPPLPRDIFLPDTQVMVARSVTGSTQGFTLAAKGGHNAESHNHNDVGHFVVYQEGQPVLIDIGVETYTRKTFGKDRYSIWTMQSQYHNLPIINGIQQKEGYEFKARDIVYRATTKAAEFSLDIAGAYPPQAGLRSWRRTLRLDRNSGVILQDHFQCIRTPHALEWSFITPCQPVPGPKGIRLAPRTLPNARSTGSALLAFDSARLKARIESLPVRDPKLGSIWGNRLFRIRFQALQPQAQEMFSFGIGGTTSCPEQRRRAVSSTRAMHESQP